MNEPTAKEAVPPPPVDSHQQPGHVFQFSTFGLLMVLTIVSVVFAAYFGVGRAVGMTNADMLQFGLLRFIYIVPMLMVWAFGLAIALRRRRQDGRRATLLIIAFGGMIATAFVVDVAQMVLIHFLTRVQAPASESLLAVLGVVSVLLNALWWILILVAIFAWPSRPNGPDDFESPANYEALPRSN